MVLETSAEHSLEVERGDRFEFGKNWARFLKRLNDQRIEQAVRSLQQLLQLDDLSGKTFLDVGCGSGLFSLAARKLGAQVHSFDYDPNSVGCCVELRNRYFPEDPLWTIESGSALDGDYLESLGKHDIVYSWGVLHHTGQMWKAIEGVAGCTKPGGRFSLAIYNDEGAWSKRWLAIKKIYNKLPRPLQPVYAALVQLPFDLKMLFSALVRLRPMEYLRIWTQYDSDRGMNRWHDILDWMGGLPFEVAKTEEILDFLRARNFELIGLKTRCNLGCNEFLFQLKD